MANTVVCPAFPINHAGHLGSYLLQWIVMIIAHEVALLGLATPCPVSRLNTLLGIIVQVNATSLDKF